MIDDEQVPIVMERHGLAADALPECSVAVAFDDVRERLEHVKGALGHRKVSAGMSLPIRQLLERARSWEVVRVRLARAHDANVPARYHHVAYDDGYETTEALDEMRAHIDGGAVLVGLVGPCGTGKSLMAARWLMAYGDATERLYTTAAALRLAMFNHGEFQEAAHLWDRAQRVPVLVVDDVGAEYDDKHGVFVARLRELLVERYERQLHTVCTTNAAVDVLSEMMGERLVSRLTASDGGLVQCSRQFRNPR